MHRLLALVALTVLVALSSARGSAMQPQAPSLLADPAPGATAAPDTSLATAASRRDTVAVRAMAVNLAALDAPAMELPLFPGMTLRAILTRRTVNRDGSESWAGEVQDEPLSSATFVRLGDVLQGSIRLLGAAYSIEPLAGSTLHIVRQVDLSQLGEELPPRVPDLPPDAPFDTPPIMGDDGNTFDVLVVYTAAARAAAGGTDGAIQARINLGIADTNTAYANSGIIPRLRLVGAEFIDYEESGDIGVDLDRLTSTVDAYMAGVHTRRNAVGADLVKLVVGEAAGGCGVAWLMTTLSAGFATNAFSVTAEECISPNYTFGHELGHNMGSNHAPNDPVTATPLYPYSFGYKHPANQFRTVMAYYCGAGACPRVLHFSNPAVNYQSAPTGTVPQHNNALSINNARTIIANWRAATDSNTAPTITSIANQSIGVGGTTAVLPFTVGDAQTAAGSLTVTASSSNTTLVPNNSAALLLGGSGANRSIRVTPAVGQSGVSTITVTVSDGALSTPTMFQVTVSAGSSAPTIAPIAAQTTNEDTAVTVNLTVADADTPVANLVVQATSNNPALVASTGLVLSGTTGTRQLVVTPVANQSGSATITVSVSDGTATAQTSFVLTVTAVNDPPVLSGVPALVSTTVGVPTSITVLVTDIDSSSGALTLTAASSNAVLLGPGSISINPQAPEPSGRAFVVSLSPAAAQAGSAVVTLTAGDLQTTAATTFSFNVTMLAAAPDAPTATSATADGTAVTVQWTPAISGSAATSFVVEMGTSPGTTSLPTQTAGAGATSLTTTLPGGTYFVRVRAVNGVGTSPPSPEATVTVTGPSPIPGPPGTFSVRAAGRSAIFTWTAPTVGEPPTRYLIEAGSAPGLADLATLDTASIGSSYTVPNVPPGTYWVRVRAANAAGTGGPSQDVSLVMGPSTGCVGLPSTPVLLTPVVSGSNVTLSWNPPALGSAPSSYVLLAGSAPGAANLAVLGTGSAATSFAASAANGVYYVRVAARNACGIGAASNEVMFTLGAELPGAPTNLDYTAVGNAFALSWTAPASGGAPTSYLIEAGSAPGLTDLAVIATGSTLTTVAGTAPAGVYYVRIHAVNGTGMGAASNEVVIVIVP
jgi:hypothetical protein